MPAPSAGVPPYAAVAETHSAVVFFLGDRAYKVRKPQDLGFLDFRTREARALDCHREVELNRRLAPDVYLGVADVTGPDGVLCDHVAVMRRLPSDRRLSSLVVADEDVVPALRSVAHQIATLHGRSERSAAADRLAGEVAMRAQWERETAALRRFVGTVFHPHLVDEVQALADRYLDGRGPLFEHRVAEGRAGDGHGDLLADDIFCLDDGPRILDCLQFDEALRLGDGLADVAFLAMDLERLGRPDLGDAFLAAYEELRPDRWPASLAHHHIAHRAQVRALVTAIRWDQGDEASAEQARGLLEMAHRHLLAGRVRLTLVGGAPGTGKSTVAAGLGVATSGVVLRSDEIRKEQAGVERSDRHADLYSDAAVAATYGVMLERAGAALRLGESVVLDGTWGSNRQRDAARALAEETAADLLEVRCDTAPGIAADRIRRRAARGDDVSDATPEVAAALAAAADPWPEAEVLDTSGTEVATVASAIALVQAHR